MANYLYGDIEAPDINAVWTDKKTHPYACVAKNRANGNAGDTLLISSAPFVVEVRQSSISGHIFGVVLDNGASTKMFYHSKGTETWADYGEYTPTTGSAMVEEVAHWSNADVYNEAGEVYMEGSDPIPVTTAAPIDPTSFMQGYIVGRRLAGMRK